MAGRQKISRDAILREATAIVGARGASALTFQALAARLGVTKQAIIYWFPTKQDLARGLALPALRAETTATTKAIRGARSAPDAIDRFLRALVAHHLADLSRFRLTYLSSQLDEQAPQIMAGIQHEVHQTSSEMYAALEVVLAADPGFAGRDAARRAAVAVHMAGIGLVTMVSLAAAVEDPLAHGTDALVDSMVQLLAGQARGQG